MLPPIGLLAAWNSHQKGMVDIRAAAFIAAGFLIGGYFGSLGLAVGLPEIVLRRTFATVLVYCRPENAFSRPEINSALFVPRG